jgi:hypothetical protein
MPLEHIVSSANGPVIRRIYSILKGMIFLGHLSFARVKKNNMVYLDSIYFCRNQNSMKVLSLKLDDNVFDETERMVSKLKLARNRYINEALSLYNKYNRRKMIKSQLAREAALSQDASMEILREFEALDDDSAI